MKKIIFTILLIASCVFNLFGQEKVKKEEYSVYGKVFETFYKGNFKPGSKIHFVILENTTGPKRTFLEGYLKHKDYSDYLYKINPQKEMTPQKMEELLSDFKKNNLYPAKLEKKFPVEYEYSLITQAELDELLDQGKRENREFINRPENSLFVGGAIWKAFLKKYPDSRGCHFLSRVGFSSNKKLALVYAHLERGDFGESWFYIFEKVNGKWGNPKMFGQARSD